LARDFFAYNLLSIAGVYYIAFKLSPTSPTTIESPPTAESPGLGEKGHLDNGNSSNPRVIVGSYPEVLAEIVQAKSVNDTIGLQEIYDRGVFFFVAKGTPVLVIDESYISAFTVIKVYKVRILAGDYTGDVGWVPDSHVKY